MNTIDDFNVPHEPELTSLLGAPTLSLRHHRVIRQVDGRRPLPAVFFRLERDVNMGAFPTQVIWRGPDGTELEAACLIGLRPALEPPGALGIVTGTEIETLRVAMIRVHYHCDGGFTAGQDNGTAHHEGNAWLLWCRYSSC
ncbi:MAG: hypothetical protein AAFX85_09890 [Pseudomonadota bacterium]